jgi:hypothetical protein
MIARRSTIRIAVGWSCLAAAVLVAVALPLSARWGVLWTLRRSPPLCTFALVNGMVGCTDAPPNWFAVQRPDWHTLWTPIGGFLIAPHEDSSRQTDDCTGPDAVGFILGLGWWLEYHRDPGGFSQLAIPLWMPFLALSAATVLLLRRRRSRLGHCPACGYNLTGNISGCCPECGAEILPG